MTKNRTKEINKSLPVEDNRTAAWANIEKLKPQSKVPIPAESEVRNAKDWVDANRK